jgi:hypothetical protein
MTYTPYIVHKFINTVDCYLSFYGLILMRFKAYGTIQPVPYVSIGSYCYLIRAWSVCDVNIWSTIRLCPEEIQYEPCRIVYTVHQVVLCRVCRICMYCIVLLAVCIVSYCTVLPEEIQWSYILCRVCRTYTYCIVGLLLTVFVVLYRTVRRTVLPAVHIILCILSYCTDTILRSCCAFSDRIKIPFSRFVFGSYPHFPRIVSWFLSGRIVWNLRYHLWTTGYDPRGVICSYSDRNATIWYLLMELAVLCKSCFLQFDTNINIIRNYHYVINNLKTLKYFFSLWNFQNFSRWNARI